MFGNFQHYQCAVPKILQISNRELFLLSLLNVIRKKSRKPDFYFMHQIDTTCTLTSKCKYKPPCFYTPYVGREVIITIVNATETHSQISRLSFGLHTLSACNFISGTQKWLNSNHSKVWFILDTCHRNRGCCWHVKLPFHSRAITLLSGECKKAMLMHLGELLDHSHYDILKYVKMYCPNSYFCILNIKILAVIHMYF